MSSSEAWAEYQVQLGYYQQLNGIRTAINSIKGSLETASFMFEQSLKDMGTCKESVDSANIILEDFNQYTTLLSNNYSSINSVITDIGRFNDNANTAFDNCERDMEIVHKYMTYLYNYYLSALEDEKYGRAPGYPPYSGEIFSGL